MPQGQLQVIFMDAGQGDSTLVVYPDDSLMLVDCGSIEGRGEVAPQIADCLARFLPKKQTNKNVIDTLVLTHPDQDHYNLLYDVETRVKKKLGLSKSIYNQVIYGGDAKSYENKTYKDVTNLLKGLLPKKNPLGNAYCDKQPHKSLTRAGVDVWILAANYPNLQTKDPNDNSVVLLLEFGSIKIFLMGDATKKTTNFILQYHNAHNKGLLTGTDVALKLSHHGSRLSTPKAWVTTLDPKSIFISAGLKKFSGTGHPSSTLINKILGVSGKPPLAPSLSSVQQHQYVQFDDKKKAAPILFQTISSKRAIYSTTEELKKRKVPKGEIIMDAIGRSIYYTITIDTKGKTDVKISMSD